MTENQNQTEDTTQEQPSFTEDFLKTLFGMSDTETDTHQERMYLLGFRVPKASDTEARFLVIDMIIEELANLLQRQGVDVTIGRGVQLGVFDVDLKIVPPQDEPVNETEES